MRSTPHRLVLTLTLNLETQSARTPTASQITQASDALREAIHTRLFEEGFLPFDVCVGTYDLTID